MMKKHGPRTHISCNLQKCNLKTKNYLKNTTCPQKNTQLINYTIFTYHYGQINQTPVEPNHLQLTWRGGFTQVLGPLQPIREARTHGPSWVKSCSSAPLVEQLPDTQRSTTMVIVNPPG